jgi:REP element-mobilizing transposase RayT
MYHCGNNQNDTFYKLHKRVTAVSRKARVKAEGLVYHITQRGNNKEKVFEYDDDKLLLIDILCEARVKFNFYIYAYCVMDNHYHLLLFDNDSDVSKVMGWINTKYARVHNFIYKKCGHVFQERFFSEVIDTDSYLYDVINYIHDNPVRASIAEKQRDYKWSSCR